MKFCLISDVHVDITAWDPARLAECSPDCNTIVVAGDISNDIWTTSRWIVELKKSFENVIWVAGNHDYYNVGFHRTRIFNPDIDKIYPYPKLYNEITAQSADWSQCYGIHFLHRSSIVKAGVRCLGATGWHASVC